MPNTPPLFEPREFYHFASWLYAVRPAVSEDALKRTIIGRAYYAALLGGSKKTGTSTVGKNGHNDVINAVQSVDSQAANQLRSMIKLRRKADYEDTKMNERDVQLCLRGAKVVLVNLGYMAANDPEYSMDYLDKTKFMNP